MYGMRRAFFVSLLFALPLLADKRPLNHNDYDSWKHIQNQQLSNDGRYLAYAVFPREGDGELIVRDLKSGKEFKQPIGELPPPPPPNYANPQVEDTPPMPPGIAVKFTSDNRALVFTTFPRRVATELAKRTKTKPDEMPKGDVVLMKLPSGEAFRATSVKNFQLSRKASEFLAYLKFPVGTYPVKAAATDVNESSEGKAKKQQVGELILRNIENGAERVFADVSEYTLSDDNKLLTFIAAGKSTDQNGVYCLRLSAGDQPQVLLKGKGKYRKLSWDEDQTRLAFLSSQGGNDSQDAALDVYEWTRESGAASKIISANSAGIPNGWVISEHGTLSLTKHGERIFFGTAPKPAPLKKVNDMPADEKVAVDLWAWNDDYIQPMQKVRAETERNRSYEAAYDCQTKAIVQMADISMREVVPSEDGRYALGFDDRAYRREQEYDERYQDVYIANVMTGGRKLAITKASGRITWSPDSKYAVFYNGKDWLTLAADSASIKNLTAKLGVTFGQEEFDSPTHPPSYGQAVWTSDGHYILLNDRFDVWRVAPDGSSAVKLTDGRINRLSFRVVRFSHGIPEDRFFDQSQPLLLRAENEDTHDSGFYRVSIKADAAPEQLVFEPENFASPIRALEAEVYVTAASTFNQFPDLLLTDKAFPKLYQNKRR